MILSDTKISIRPTRNLSIQTMDSVEKELGAQIFSNPNTALETVLTVLLGGTTTSTYMASSSLSGTFVNAIERQSGGSLLQDINPQTLQISTKTLKEDMAEVTSPLVILSNPFNQDIDTATDECCYSLELTTVQVCDGFPTKEQVSESLKKEDILIAVLPHLDLYLVYTDCTDLEKQIHQTKLNYIQDIIPYTLSTDIREILTVFDTQKNQLKDLEGLMQEKLTKAGFSPVFSSSNHWFRGYPIWVESATRAAAHLQSYGIYGEAFQTVPDLFDTFTGYDGCGTVSNKVVCVPFYSGLDEAYLDLVVKVLLEVENKS